MSFILDALQKDQVEQQPQAVPTGALPPLRPSPVKRWWPWIIGAALLVNAGVLAWYLLGQQAPTSNVAPSVPGAQRELAITPPTSSNAQPTSRPAEQTTNVAGTDRIPRRTPVRNPRRNPVAAPTRDSAASASRSQPTRTPAARNTASNTSSNSTSSSASNSGAGRVLSPEQASQMGIGDDLLDEPNQAAAQASRPVPTESNNTQTDPAPKPRSSASANTVTIAELPTAARNSFPELEFTTHIFADDPSMRAVVVNDKRLTEGEQLGELILRAVTEEGVVFGYRDHRVAVSVVDLWAD